MRVHKTPWLRRLGVLVGIASLTASAVAAPARADEVSDKRAEAARIAEQVEAEGEKVSILAERLNEARLRAEKAEAGVAATQAALAKTDALVAERRETLKTYAVRSYINGGAMSELQMLMGGGTEAGDIAVRAGYVKAVTAQQRAALDALAEAREQAEAKRRDFEAVQKQARVALAAVEADRRTAESAARQAQATLDRVEGELAALVQAESQRRAEEAARRAQAEMAARQAQDATRARATPSTTAAPRPSSGGSTGTDPGPAPAPNPGAQKAIDEAKRQIGKPYEYGADGPDSFDCSGLTQWAWRAGGVSLPHSSKAQYSSTARVSIDDIQPGDLTFYGNPIHHVGIYIGNGTMVEASQTGTPVRYASIYRKDLVGVGRVGG